LALKQSKLCDKTARYYKGCILGISVTKGESVKSGVSIAQIVWLNRFRCIVCLQHFIIYN